MVAQSPESNRRVPEWRARSLGTLRDFVRRNLDLAANVHDGLPSLSGDLVIFLL